MAKRNNIDTREEILKCLESELEHNSFSSITLSDISKKVKISQGTLYYYYKSKDQMIMDIVKRTVYTSFSDFEKWITNEDKDRSLHRIVKFVLQAMTKIFTIRLSLMEESSNNEKLRLQINNLYNSYFDLISKYTADKIEGIEPKYFAELLSFISDGLLVQKKIGNDKVDIDQIIDYSSIQFEKWFAKK